MSGTKIAASFRVSLTAPLRTAATYHDFPPNAGWNFD
jgi:hypothetical protein